MNFNTQIILLFSSDWSILVFAAVYNEPLYVCLYIVVNHHEPESSLHRRGAKRKAFINFIFITELLINNRVVEKYVLLNNI